MFPETELRKYKSLLSGKRISKVLHKIKVQVQLSKYMHIDCKWCKTLLKEIEENVVISNIYENISYVSTNATGKINEWVSTQSSIF